MLLVAASACSSSDDASNEKPLSSTSVPTNTSAPSTESEHGDPAIWFVSDEEPPTAASTSFTADVTRLGCNGGVTGTVLEPRIESSETSVVVTFDVTASPGPHECPSNDRVPVVVELGTAIGDRQLVDGACRSDRAATTVFCRDGSVRWPFPPAP